MKEKCAIEQLTTFREVTAFRRSVPPASLLEVTYPRVSDKSGLQGARARSSTSAPWCQLELSCTAVSRGGDTGRSALCRFGQRRLLGLGERG